MGPSQFGVEHFTVPGVLDQRAAEFPDRVLMSIAGTPVTFEQMRDRSCAAANALLDIGVGRGDTVALFTATCPEWVYFWLGAARIGAVTAAVNVANKDDFLVHALRLSRAKVVITDAERDPRVREVVDRVETVKSVLVVGDSLSDVMARASSSPPDAAPAEPGDVAALFFTSGTTGPSKAVATTWHYLFSAAAGVAAAWELEAGDVVWSAMPLFHLSAAPSVLGADAGRCDDGVVSGIPAERSVGRGARLRRSGFRRSRCHGLDALEPAAGSTRLAASAEIHLGGADLGRHVPQHRAALRRQDRDDVRHDGGVPDRVQDRFRGRCSWDIGTGERRIRCANRRQRRTFTACGRGRRDHLQAEVGPRDERRLCRCRRDRLAA